MGLKERDLHSLFHLLNIIILNFEYLPFIFLFYILHVFCRLIHSQTFFNFLDIFFSIKIIRFSIMFVSISFDVFYVI